jgi:hypothetical protein
MIARRLDRGFVFRVGPENEVSDVVLGLGIDGRPESANERRSPFTLYWRAGNATFRAVPPRRSQSRNAPMLASVRLTSPFSS